MLPFSSKAVKTGQVLLRLLISLISHFALSPLPSATESSLLLRAHLIRLGPSGKSTMIPLYFKLVTLTASAKSLVPCNAPSHRLWALGPVWGHFTYTPHTCQQRILWVGLRPPSITRNFMSHNIVHSISQFEISPHSNQNGWAFSPGGLSGRRDTTGSG